MQTSRRNFLKLSGGVLAGAAVAAGAVSQVRAHAPRFAVPQQIPASSDPVLHMLNRVTYGPRPEEVEYVRQIGIEAYLEEQLNPEAIDDSAMDALLTRIPILAMSRAEANRITQREYRTYKALVEGMILRAVHSRRQLLERMEEFWTDHFNIPSDYSTELVGMHRDVIRKHALGNFRDLVMGTAQHPAMLDYLDNDVSSKEHPNENYARELMELHTLGVDGGYAEQDVQEAARALTGWTVNNATSSGFYFDRDSHDTDPKEILGVSMPGGRGIEDGLHLIDILVHHPSTARFIARKLLVRFVTDQPSEDLIASTAQVFSENNQEIKPVLRHIFNSSEFQQSAGQKLRRPLDFFIGALRVTGTQFQDFWSMEERFNDLAQPPYGWQPPNGYPDVAIAWMNSSGLLARWNVAMDLTQMAYSELDSRMTVNLRQLIDDPQTVAELVDQVAYRVFVGPLSDQDRATFIAYVAEDGNPDAPVTYRLLSDKLGTLFGLMLASPTYQWR
jgi:uncharacterized protein (DUF1800 family)